MPFSTATKATLRKKLPEYEGYIKHIYIDTLGNITVGVGHLLSNKNAMSGITLYKKQNKILTQPATLQEKFNEYEKIRKLPWGKTITAGSFRKSTSLEMKPSDIDFLTNKHIDSFHINLKNIITKKNSYPNEFDNLNSNLQLALFDLIFNLGAPKFVSKFPKFHNAFKASEYEKMAKESHRSDIDNDRNNHVRDLILSLIPEVEA